jgi:predicted short-subunit dehydrogenase-like oxidoreductase (DUF2520 family)
MNREPLKITFIGAGNVATQMGLALKKAGHLIFQIYSPSGVSARSLALKLRAIPVTSLEKLLPDADLFILAIKDDAVLPFLKKLKLKPALLVHTSGSLPMSVLKGASVNFGVIYPVQTLSKNRVIDFSRVPLCIEANGKKTEKQLLHLARSISGQVRLFNSDQRRILHLSAIFAGNFSNHLYALAEQLLRKNKMSFDLLLPLIRETAEKVKSDSPASMQTGPAARNDKKIMKKHLQLLSEDKNLQGLYEAISKSILKTYSTPSRVN